MHSQYKELGPEDRGQADQARWSTPEFLVKWYLFQIIPLLKRVSDHKFQLAGHKGHASTQITWSGIISWMGEMGYREELRVTMPEHLMRDHLQDIHNTLLSPAMELHLAMMYVGKVLAPYMPCERCEGLGHFRGAKQGYTRRGRMIHMLGDASLVCNRCHGYRIDPEWRAKLEEDPPGTFKEYRQGVASGKIKKHWMLNEVGY